MSTASVFMASLTERLPVCIMVAVPTIVTVMVVGRTRATLASCTHP